MSRSSTMQGMCVAVVAVALSWAATTGALTVKEGEGTLDAVTLVTERMRPEIVIDRLEAVESSTVPELTAAWSAFATAHGGSWATTVDRRSGVLELAEGSGIPWVPGYGNQLTLADMAPYTGGGEVTLAALEARAREFVRLNQGLFGVSEASLELRQGASGRFSDYLWFVEFEIRRADLPIDGARVVFRVNNGNLVQFGTENLPPAGVVAPQFAISRVDALVTLSQWVGGLADERDWLLDPGTRRLLPVTPAASESPEDFDIGHGYELMAVWELVLRREGETGTYRARIDATTGEMVEFKDVNAYASVTGGVYPVSFWFADETVLPMPFADVSGVGFTDSAGQYTWPGGTVNSTLTGQYVNISDTCGSISLGSDADGNISFGTSTGTDCATPGFGGAGNTHASRMQFYQTNRIAEKARAWLPSNTWVQQRLTVNVNINNQCNARWDGSTTNFYRSGGGCGNTGEMAGVSLHEWGHGFDQNDGNGFSPDGGTGEAYGDFTAALQTHDSCVGWGFRSSPCGGYGDPCLSCTGVRDIDWGQHSSNTPHTVSNFTRTCPSGDICPGPCNRECHCESYPASEALWDFASKDLVAGIQSTNPLYPDADGPYTSLGASWQVVDRLWYLSRPTAGAAFVCSTAGSWSSHGCGSSNWWKVFRIADDDDGNLDNGTPHSCYMYPAFNRHMIACTTDTAAAVCFTGCTAPSIPTLTAIAGNSEVDVSWTSSGGGVVYDLFRNEAGCGSGFTKIAEDLTGTTFTDTAVANNYTYYYQVAAQPVGNEACSSAPSNCDGATPIPCTPPVAPGSVTATTNGDNRIDVTWTAVPDAIDYHVYRSRAAGGPYEAIATVPAPTLLYVDSDVSGGTTYFYVVTTEDDCTESEDSVEASATATGLCTLSPDFGGVDSVTSPLTTMCTLDLSWSAGVPWCGGPVTYNVYRSTTSGFVPDTGNRVATGVADTVFTDAAGLVQGTTYYYVVRAVDQGNGAEDVNLAELSGIPAESIRFADDFESGNVGWVFSKGTPPATTGDFVIGDPVGTTGNYGDDSQPEDDHTPGSGVNCLYTAANPGGGAGTNDVDEGEVIATSPTFDGSGLTSLRLDMWRWFFNEDNDDAGDYYTLEVSNDDGASWSLLENIPGTVTNTNTWTNVQFDLENHVLGLTSTMKIRVRVADGTATGDLIEAAIDDIVITGYANCSTTADPPFFTDGFELGDTSGWDLVRP